MRTLSDLRYLAVGETIRQKQGSTIRGLRKSRNLSLVELGTMVQMSKDVLSRIELGKRGIDTEELVAIANAFGLDPQHLLIS